MKYYNKSALVRICGVKMDFQCFRDSVLVTVELITAEHPGRVRLTETVRFPQLLVGFRCYCDETIRVMQILRARGENWNTTDKKEVKWTNGSRIQGPDFFFESLLFYFCIKTTKRSKSSKKSKKSKKAKKAKTNRKVKTKQ